MIWIFQRDGQVVRLETHFDIDASEYVLKVSWYGRPETVERFEHGHAFTERLMALDQQLRSGRWSQIDSPRVTYNLRPSVS